MFGRKDAERTNRCEMRSRMTGFLLFIPNMVRLLIALLRDDRVSKADKAILAGTIVYVISPIDIIPDFIPFIGQVDDAYLLAISILRLLNRADRNVVLEHWRGDLDIKQLVTNIAMVAEYFLPKRIKNVLHGRIERAGTPGPRLANLDSTPSAAD
jgi:uncharacterized membrane protein YkvA (DUF1232 family)